jgi:hypothetical protein
MSAMVKSRHETLNSRCPLYPQKRTLPGGTWMFAKCPKQLQQDALTELLFSYSSTRAASRVCRDRDVGVWCNFQVLALSTEYS